MNKVHHHSIIAVWLVILLAVGGALRADDTLPRAKSLEFDPDSGEWVDLAPPVAGTPEGDLQLARALHTDKQHNQALKAVKKWFKTYGEDHDLYPQARLLECAVRIAKRDYYKAHVRLQEFLNEFAGTEYEEQALTQEFVIAEVFLAGTKRKFLGIRFLKADDVGLSILDDISANHPGTQLAELAMMTKANYYFQTGDFAFAEQEYSALVETFSRSRYVRRATLQAARAALASFPGIEFDDAALIEAEERFSRYLAQYPGSAEQEGIGLIVAYISGTRAAKKFSIGEYYERTGHGRAAQFYYRSTMKHWPETIAALQAAERLRAAGADLEMESAPSSAPMREPDPDKDDELDVMGDVSSGESD